MNGWMNHVQVPGFRGWQMAAQYRDLDVSIGGVTFSTTGQEWAITQDSLIVMQSLTGWWDSVRVSTSTFDHSSGDGVVAGMQELEARTVTVSGFVAARTPAALMEARDTVSRASGVMTIDERARMLSREATVRKVGLTWQRRTALLEFFTLTLQADDPLLYGSGVRDLSNGANVLVNRGDRTAWPVLEVSGTGALTIAHAGGSYSLTATPSNQTRVVDLRNGDVWNGNVRMFGVESGPAPRVAPGGGSWTVSGIGSGSARVRRFEAWS